MFFWITLSHKVSRHFPIHQHTQTLRTFYIYTVHRQIPFHWWRIQCPVEGGTNPGSSVADCVQTVIFQNIRGIRTPYHVNRETNPGGVPHTLDLRSTTKEMDK